MTDSRAIQKDGHFAFLLASLSFHHLLYFLSPLVSKDNRLQLHYRFAKWLVLKSSPSFV